MTTDTTFEIVKDDISNFTHYYPALRPIMQEARHQYPAVERTQVPLELRRAVHDSTP